MPKMVNNSVVNVPFYQEKRKNSSPNNSSTADANGGAAITTMENNEHLRKIFVGGLSLNTSAAMMRTFFSQFGPVADTVVMRDPISNRSRGFGFVTYADSESVENVQRARPHIIDSKTVDTKRAFPRHEFNKAVGHLSNIKTNKIFLGGLKDCHDEDSLRDYFRKFGNVTSVKVLTDKDTGRKRGFGFLEFEDTASAGRALAQGKHSINMITVEVKKSTQMAESSKRIRLPIGGAACAGYAPPQPTIMDNFVYSGNYNPYQAQTSLPPSAFFNGWASYVAPTVPSTYPRYPHRPPPVAAYAAQGAAWPHGSWPANNYGPVASWPMKGGPKHGPMMNERPKNEYKSVQAEEATKQKLSKPSIDENAAGDVEKKWLAKEYKVFKPSGKYNFNASQTNHITSLGNDGSTPAYGI
ncbi:RNA-binding protein Musashi homolog Rbp6 [Drosophila nasuta]|uniref:RNA-binding protein Musashi homolog Rbp6 n=1 Tax=Drosophila nasuta TaxID=42062 RepID=UPI00295EEEB1|nr:RNA-binding protein Musashi homolog Rbp6 [Drosophila nasuta]